MDPTRDPTFITRRKDDHLDLCETQNVNSEGVAGWDLVDLPHCALPDLNFSEVNLETEFLGRNFSAPIMISSMTGGSEKGEKINAILARFAQEANIPMGVGSQRIALEKRDDELFNLRTIAPEATFYANLGAIQLNYNVSTQDCLTLIKNLDAQAFILHLNPLQEAIQKEGDRNFKGLWPKITELCKNSPVPIILKETGCGLDRDTCFRARDAGVKALDIAGFGGTHWGYIEGLRNPDRSNFGEIFRSWGIPTAKALHDAREVVGFRMPIIASGGIKNGLDISKSLYMGANMAGLALPFLKAAQNIKENPDSLKNLYFDLTEAIRIALFCADCKSVSALQEKGKGLYENKSH